MGSGASARGENTRHAANWRAYGRGSDITGDDERRFLACPSGAHRPTCAAAVAGNRRRTCAAMPGVRRASRAAASARPSGSGRRGASDRPATSARRSHWPGWRPSRLAVRSPGSGPWDGRDGWDGRDTCRPSHSSPQYSPNCRLTHPKHLSHLGLRVVLAQLRDLGVTFLRNLARRRWRKWPRRHKPLPATSIAEQSRMSHLHQAGADRLRRDTE